MNQIFFPHGIEGGAGFANKGYQLLLPISPVCCLVAYDAACYRIGRPEKRTMLIDRGGDIDLINALQVITADEHLYFHDPQLGRYALQLVSKFESLRSGSKSRVHRKRLPKPNGDEGLLIISTNPGAALPGNWSFCKNRINVVPTDFGPRNPELCRLVDRWHTETLRGKDLSFTEWLECP